MSWLKRYATNTQQRKEVELTAPEGCFAIRVQHWLYISSVEGLLCPFLGAFLHIQGTSPQLSGLSYISNHPLCGYLLPYGGDIELKTPQAFKHNDQEVIDFYAHSAATPHSECSQVRQPTCRGWATHDDISQNITSNERRQEIQIEIEGHRRVRQRQSRERH